MFRQWVVTWRTTGREWVPGAGRLSCLVLTVLISIILAVLLMISRAEQNPDSVVEVENTVRLLCDGCCRNLKSGIQYELYERCYKYSCGSVKTEVAERENWNCEMCRTEKARMLHEKLQNALRQKGELKARNREL